MSDRVSSSDPPLRGRAAWWLVVALVVLSARIAVTRARDGHTPFLSANDRSRWLTVRALVEDGTYAVDKVVVLPGWNSIDKVRHRGTDQQWHYYSSKPPLMATLIAACYAAIYHGLGVSFADYPFALPRALLLLLNGIPLYFYLRWVEQTARATCATPFGYRLVVGCGTFGTFVTTFGNTLSNHLWAACCVGLALGAFWRMTHDASARRSALWMALAGAFSAGAFAFELPALSFLALATATALWLSPRRACCYFLPVVALVLTAYFATNWIAHGSWSPPYAHRGANENWYDYPGSYWMKPLHGVDAGEPSPVRYLFHVLLGHHGFFSLTPIWLVSLVGAVMWLREVDVRRRYVALVSLVLWLTCVIFYVWMTPAGQRDRNYGGVACGFRWLFWLIPFWLLHLAPAADWLSHRLSTRILGRSLLAISIFSATLPLLNPWTHPWIYQWLTTGRLVIR